MASSTKFEMNQSPLEAVKKALQRFVTVDSEHPCDGVFEFAFNDAKMFVETQIVTLSRSADTVEKKKFFNDCLIELKKIEQEN